MYSSFLLFFPCLWSLNILFNISFSALQSVTSSLEWETEGKTINLIFRFLYNAQKIRIRPYYGAHLTQICTVIVNDVITNLLVGK
jgi:hypothetical protein